MKFKVDAMIAKQLVRVNTIIQGKMANAILENIHIIADTNGLLFTASNGSQHVSVDCAFNEVEVIEEGQIIVDSKRLVSVINALNDSKAATFTVQGEADKQKLIVQSGRSRSQIQCSDGHVFPLVNVVFSSEQVNLSVPFRTFIGMYHDVAPFAAVNDVRTALNHYNLTTNIATGQLRLCATNGHCVSVSYTPLDLSGLQADVNLVVPRACFSALGAKCFDEKSVVNLQFDERWFQLKCGNTTFSSVSVDQSFPDVDRVIPRMANAEIVVNIDEFLEAVQRVSIINNKVNPSVTCLAENGELRIISNNRSTGESCEDAVSYQMSRCDSPTCEFSVMPQYLINALNSAHGDTAIVKCGQPNLPISICTSQSNNVCVIAPCRA
ncbi:DNA polymerase III subunit beta [Motilimonas eburnea]|uniref:DNA polymerase III subunit beta n=1 Tax=Motilimonas eburnea TaxID=1737488 RepID=UPI001E5ED26E|nr:DNA polymerase III subunit beta [Motilimonas eburnea]MCE2571714.1 DNA polymerase III subunit beta [Motilimonas eburnea]